MVDFQTGVVPSINRYVHRPPGVQCFEAVVVVKILQVPYCFYPDPVGGTEVYVESLAHELQRAGDHVVIAAPAKHRSDLCVWP